jgi:phosphatidylserine/phosphatidylglycerophosphate/cardiolipin synthase-like enzyme
MKRRGVWELSTERLGDLARALDRAGDAVCTETQLQGAGFDRHHVSALVGMPAPYARALAAAVLAERTEHPRPQLDLVWSGPEPAQAQSRDTGQVLRELFGVVEQRVIIAGFAFYGAKSIFETLYRRALERPLEIEFFIHLDPTSRNQQMTPANFFQYTWPWPDVVPRVYYDARADGDGDEAQGSMHAKCVVVDETTTFITSANFTGAAQTTNVEVGVLVRDPQFAIRVASQWRSLVARDLFSRFTR